MIALANRLIFLPFDSHQRHRLRHGRPRVPAALLYAKRGLALRSPILGKAVELVVFCVGSVQSTKRALVRPHEKTTITTVKLGFRISHI